MKGKRGRLIVVLLLLGILVSCGKEQTYEPKEIDPEIDVCAVCNMSVASEMFATQLILKDGDVYKYDDIGCMIEMIETDSRFTEDNIAKKYVRDVETGDWVELEDAFYVYHPDIWTPMAYGVVSFATKEKAIQFMEEEGVGEMLDYAQLKKHPWSWK